MKEEFTHLELPTALMICFYCSQVNKYLDYLNSALECCHFSVIFRYAPISHLMQYWQTYFLLISVISASSFESTMLVRSFVRSVGRQQQSDGKIGHIDLKCDTLAGVATFRMDTRIQMICFRARTGRWHHIDICNCNRFVSTTYIQISHENFWHPTENVISIVKSQFMPVDHSDKFNCRLILFPFCDDDDDDDDNGAVSLLQFRLLFFILVFIFNISFIPCNFSYWIVNPFELLLFSLLIVGHAIAVTLPRRISFA